MTIIKSTQRLIDIQGRFLYILISLLPILPLFLSRISNAFFALAALIPCALFILDRQWPMLLRSPLSKVICAWFCFALVSLSWTFVPHQAFMLWLQILAMFIAVYALIYSTSLLESATLSRILLSLVAGLSIALVIANIEIVSQGMLTRFFRSFLNKEYHFTIVDMNRGSVIMAFLVWPALFFLWQGGKKTAAYALYALAIVTILRLESQSAAMSIILGSLMLPFIFFTGKKGIYMTMVATGLLIMLVPYLALHMDPETVFKTLPTIPNAASEYRLHIWHYAATKASLHPWLGFGFDASRNLPTTPEEMYGTRYPMPLHPHDNILQVWLELGIVGLLFFFTFLATMMHRISSIESRTAMAFSMALMTAVFAVGATGYGIWQHWLIAGGLLASVLLIMGMRQLQLRP